jgi:iron complex transport system substrate-binding protein
VYPYTSAVRRTLALVTALGAVLLAGCASPTPTDTRTTRTVVQEIGNVEVPVAPKKILALDEYSALGLLSVGVKPDLVFATLNSQIGAQTLRDAGVTVQDEPSFLASPDIEKVAAAAPDMVVLSESGPLPSVFPQLNAIAPTVALPYQVPWRDMLGAIGTAMDRTTEADAAIGRLERRIAEVKAGLGGPRTLSILFGYGGAVYTPLETTPLSGLVEEAGFTRVASEQNLPAAQDGTIASISLETLGTHDAQSAALLTDGYYDSATVRDAPSWAGLPVAARATDVDGDMWFGSHPFAISWILDDLDAIGKGTPAGTAADASTRWQRFTATP